MLNELAKCEQVMKEILQLMANWNGQNVSSVVIRRRAGMNIVQYIAML